MKSMLKISLVLLLLVVSFPVLFCGCSKTNNTNQNQPLGPGPNDLEILFVYGSEKEKWIEEVTREFNNAKHKSESGKNIYVKAVPLGSGETIDEVLSGRLQAHIVSPASGAFITLGNAKSRAKTGEDLVEETKNLVLSPVVIAMWKPMAEALGWGKKPIGWTNIMTLSKNPNGWASLGHPEWGQFRFGHTHPEYSNSGLISIIAEVYAATGKVAGLTLADVNKPETGKYIAAIENSVVHYGSSTGFFGRTMFKNGPGYLSAAVLYENMVIESYSENNLAFPVVAIYPKEGTFWSDHPAGIVNREWVTDEQKKASQQYLDFLLDKPQQQKAMAYGFRPSDVNINLASPLDKAHGIDPMEPKTTLEVPSAEVMDAIIKLWRVNKKKSNIVLLLDVSGSMNDYNKINQAKEGAKTLIDMLDPNDTISVLTFNDQTRWIKTNTKLSAQAKEQLKNHIDGIFADGGTSLYSAILKAYRHILKNTDRNKISALVVLSDGADTSSQISLDDLIFRIDSGSEGKGVRIFTISYGKDADRNVLDSISNSTKAKGFEGTPDNIREVFKEISTFF